MVRYHSSRTWLPPWPNEVPLQSGQSYLTDEEWIDIVEFHISDIEAVDSLIDRARLLDAREALLGIRRFHYAELQQATPRWKGRMWL